jgi:hypothetical protein
MKASSAYVDEFAVVSLLEVVKDGSVVEEGQVGHVLCLFVLWGVHLTHKVLLERLFLKTRIKQTSFKVLFPPTCVNMNDK